MFRSINSCFPPFYLLALKDVAYHLWRGPDDLDVLPFVGQHPPPGHDDQQISDVGDIRDAPQGVVHHYFLEEEKELRLVGGKRERLLYLQVRVEHHDFLRGDEEVDLGRGLVLALGSLHKRRTVT